MTDTNLADGQLLKADARGRVRTPAARRESLLAEFEHSGLSGAKFAELASIKVPHSSGSTFDYSVAYNWDALNRLDQVDDANDTVIPTRYTYDAAGNLGTVAYPNGVVTTYNYNSLNRLTSMNAASSAGTLAAFNYNPSETGRTLGASGNRRAARETLQLPDGGVIARKVDYDYDRLYRLTKEDIALDTANTDSTRAHGTVTYDATPGYSDLSSGLGYDRVGNRHSRSLSGANSALSTAVPTFTGRNYDRNDWVDNDAVADNTNPNFDANGNTLAAASGDLTSGAVVPSLSSPSAPDVYDFENRLIQRTDGASTPTTIALMYDGDGNRVRKTVVHGSTTTRTDFLVDDRNPTGYAQVLEEIETVNTGTPTLKRQYVYGHSLISENLVGSPTTIHYYGMDGHGNVRFLLNTSGQISDAYNYDAFGILLDQWPAIGQTDNCYLYCGEQWDSDLGLYFLRARYMNPQTGIFWTMDTSEGGQGDPQSLHKYLFCGADPINVVDPTGHDGDLISLNVVVGLMVFEVGHEARGAHAALSKAQALFGGDANLNSLIYGLDVTTIVDEKVGLVALGGAALAGGFRILNLFTSFLSGPEAEVVTETAIRNLQKVADCLTEASCFPKGTLVWGQNGEVPIERIRSGDNVWAWNEQSEQFMLEPVIATVVRHTTQLVDIATIGETITCTPEHPLWVVGSGWTSAGNLTTNDLLLSFSGAYVQVVGVDYRHTNTTVYNLDISLLHTYTVGSQRIVVHNSCSWEARKASLPDAPGVYIVENARLGIKYVGRATNLKNRLSDVWGKGFMDHKLIDIIKDPETKLVTQELTDASGNIDLKLRVFERSLKEEVGILDSSAVEISERDYRQFIMNYGLPGFNQPKAH